MLILILLSPSMRAGVTGNLQKMEKMVGVLISSPILSKIKWTASPVPIIRLAPKPLTMGILPKKDNSQLDLLIQSRIKCPSFNRTRIQKPNKYPCHLPLNPASAQITYICSIHQKKYYRKFPTSSNQVWAHIMNLIPLPFSQRILCSQSGAINFKSINKAPLTLILTEFEVNIQKCKVRKTNQKGNIRLSSKIQESRQSTKNNSNSLKKRKTRLTTTKMSKALDKTKVTKICPQTDTLNSTHKSSNCHLCCLWYLSHLIGCTRHQFCSKLPKTN